MARIWLHIGLHKTGTSAMQNWCAEHADILLRERVLYMQMRKNLPACGLLAAALIRKSPEGPELVNHVIRQIDEHQGAVDDVIISSEDFSYFGPDSIALLMEQLRGHDIIMLIWLRRQDRFAEAMYKQTVKWNGKIKPIEEFIAGSWARCMDYNHLLEVWQTAFPYMSIKPQIYAEPGLNTKPDSVAAILTAIGREDIIPADSADYRMNLSPRRDLILHYSGISTDKAKALRQANRQIMKEYGDAASGRGDFLSAEMAAALMQHHAASNAEVARRWFPERTELFPSEKNALQPEQIDAEILTRFNQIFAKKSEQ